MVLAVAAFGVATLLWWRGQDEALEVETASVSRGVVEDIVANTRAGTVKARRRAKLSPQTGGLVMALPHRRGALVGAEELLLKLDDRVQRAQLELAEKELSAAAARKEEACAAAALAQREWERGGRLAADGIISAQNLDLLASRWEQSRAACAASQALVAQAQASLKLAQEQLSLTELRAPFAGVVAELSTEVGEWITPAPPGVPIPPVIDLVDLSELYVAAPIDELDIARVPLGAMVRVTVDPRPGVVFTARVSKLPSYVLDVAEQNRTAELEVEFDAGQDLTGVLPGASADVEIIVARHEGVLRVPTSAVAEGRQVLVLEKGKLVERHIRTGLANWQVTEVVEGLQEGEPVVVSRDRPEIQPGVKARPKA